ncbi:MAG: HPr family phosphocarrier protein [Gammaproteobacteria bacterium]|nr:HPr family phosphocarrier protein [Gammaproteobacteria bacterium]
MISEKVTIINKLGLHARASIKLVNLAGHFSAESKLTLDNKTVNCKSIMGIMMLGAAKGTELELTVSGSDELEAFTQIKALFENRFDEAE